LVTYTQKHVDAVFKALGDPTRRRLLDRLFKRDGQTLSQLCEGLEMTRFGAMKHLRILEEAGLLTTRKVGREKLHYLNPVPVQRIADRWISKYAAPFTRALTVLKHDMERTMEKPRHVYEIYIRTTPEKLWQAITDPAFTRQYFYGSRVQSDFRVGSPIAHLDDAGGHMLDGKIVEVDPPRKLVHTFSATHDEEERKDRPSRVTWEIVPRGQACLLRLTHDDFDGETRTYRSVGAGWNPVLSGLKTLLETGAPLVIQD
jgi:uncharacterized protein YndB with AHSA1/START domain/DNA-binding transcriptional ArsR family regulator